MSHLTLDGIERNADGHIVPTCKAVLRVKRKYRGRAAGELVRLAQAQTLIDWSKRQDAKEAFLRRAAGKPV